MKPMIATKSRGTRSSRIASSRSWNGVVNVSSSATWTDSQLFSTTVVARARPSPLMSSVIGPTLSVAIGSPGPRKMIGTAASRKGSATNEPRTSRSGPMRATHASSTSTTNATSSAT